MIRLAVGDYLIDGTVLVELLRCGSIERVVTADETTLTQIPGIGPKKAARIRELVC